MQVLIVEKDRGIAQNIDLLLRIEGIKSYETCEGEDAIDLAKIYNYDLIILGDDLVDMPTMAVIQGLRRAAIKAPVLILSHWSSNERVCRMLDAGADDYMSLPMTSSEFASRTKALIRRSLGQVSNVIEFGSVAIDIGEKILRLNGRKLHLTGKEYQVMEGLAMRAGMTLTKENLLNLLYDERDAPEIKIIDVFVCKLRRKLREAGGPDDFIQTVWGRGYMIPKVEPIAQAA